MTVARGRRQGGVSSATYNDDDPFQPVTGLRVQQFHQSRLKREGVVDPVVQGSARREGSVSQEERRDLVRGSERHMV
jgi:hypothetical protein